MLRPCMSGTRCLCGLRPTVTPFPMWTALPLSEYYEVIRLPMDHRPSFWLAYLAPGIHAVSQVPDASLHAYHALKWTPADPREANQNASSVEASGALKPSPSALLPLRGCIKLQGVRSPLRSTWCPVYASTASFGSHLLRSCNTRYEWLVKPCSAGTYTLQEAPSCAWRTNARFQARPIAAARHERSNCLDCQGGLVYFFSSAPPELARASDASAWR